MSKFLIFDIETVPNIPLIRQRLKGQETMTDAEVVKMFVVQESDPRDQKKRDMVQTSHQTPVAIGYLKVDELFQMQQMGVYDRPHYRTAEAVTAFWRDVEQSPCVVHFNGRTFDIPVLEFAAYDLGLDIGWWMTRNSKNYEQPRNRYSATTFDLMDIYGNYSACPLGGGLDMMAKRIGCPGKMDVSGNQVWDLYQAGKYAEIADYCQCDVLDTYWVFLRYARNQGWVSAEAEMKLRMNFKNAKPPTKALAEYNARFNPSGSGASANLHQPVLSVGKPQ